MERNAPFKVMVKAGVILLLSRKPEIGKEPEPFFSHCYFAHGDIFRISLVKIQH